MRHSTKEVFVTADVLFMEQCNDFIEVIQGNYPPGVSFPSGDKRHDPEVFRPFTWVNYTSIDMTILNKQSIIKKI